MFSSIFLAVGSNFEISPIVDLAIMIFSLVLFALAITAYKNTKVKKIAFAAVAFALFAIQLAIQYTDDAFHIFEDQIDVVLSLITLGILLLFFFAVVKKS